MKNVLNKFEKLSNILYLIIVAAVLFIAGGTALSVFEAPGGYRMFVVMSGSMKPKIGVGSVVLVGKKQNYKTNDIITFLKNPSDKLNDVKTTITHRITEIHNDTGQTTFVTKGDANEASDPEMVTKGQVLGKVILSIPYAGRAIAFTKTQTGFILLIVIPAVILIYNETLNIKKEIIKIIKNRKNKSNEK